MRVGTDQLGLQVYSGERLQQAGSGLALQDGRVAGFSESLGITFITARSWRTLFVPYCVFLQHASRRRATRALQEDLLAITIHEDDLTVAQRLEEHVLIDVVLNKPIDVGRFRVIRPIVGSDSIWEKVKAVP